jgi:L,D-peptidoglycan transpeptidase YkuD (ErfK/YbiS/YcfS/YnhG family)
VTTAFGLSPNPGTRLAYRHSNGDDYWSGDPTDPKTYNLYQTWASPNRTWRLTTATSERVASYPTQYAYAAVINAYRPPDASITYNAVRGQYETSQPTATGHGFSIFLHVNGRGSTAGRVSVDAANLLRVLRWLDPTKAPRITMAPKEWLASA